MQAKVFDSEAALNRLDGDEELLDDVIGFFLEDAPKYRQLLRESLRAEDANPAHRAAHSLKGLAAQVGGLRAMEIARDIVKLIPDSEQSQPFDLAPPHPDFPAAMAKLASLEQEFDHLQGALQEYRRRHPVVRRPE